MARQPAPFNLTVNDQLELESWLRMGTLSQNLVQRARILLLLNAGQSPKEVMESLDVSSPTVFKWRNRYTEQGLTGLRDASRPGQPRKLVAEKAQGIHDSFILKQKMTSEDRKALMAAVPNAFVQRDRAFHEISANLVDRSNAR